MVLDQVVTRSSSELVNSIRSAFKLSITDLAAILGVERPTVYSWLKDSATPSVANDRRLQSVFVLADTWSQVAADNQGPALRAQTTFGGTLLDALKSQDLSLKRLKEHLIAEAKMTRRNAPRDYAALARQAAVPPRPDTDFDIATGRPLGPES